MGLTCSSKTVKKLTMKAAKNHDGLIMKLLEFIRIARDRSPEDEENEELLKTISEQPYVFFGHNNIPHHIVYNGENIQPRYVIAFFFKYGPKWSYLI
jgi:hypothetical protein